MNDEDQDAEGAQLLIEKNYEKKKTLIWSCMIQGLGHPCLPKTTFNSDAFHSRFLTLYMHATYLIIGIFKLVHFSPKKKNLLAYEIFTKE